VPKGRNKAIEDFSHFKVNEVYGTKPLCGCDSIFLEFLKRATQNLNNTSRIQAGNPEKLNSAPDQCPRKSSQYEE
jgi:hypothetical protein